MGWILGILLVAAVVGIIAAKPFRISASKKTKVRPGQSKPWAWSPAQTPVNAPDGDLQAGSSPDLPEISFSTEISAASSTGEKQTFKNNKLPKVNNHIFRPFDLNQLGNSLLDDTIRQNRHYIAFYHIGTFDNGNQFSITIGYSDEWVNITTLTRAKIPTYKTYGFSILDHRWSYGSNVFGAPHFRKLIADNMYEIVTLMKTQSKIRDEKKRTEEVQDAKTILEQENFEEQEAVRQKQLQRVISRRKPVIENYFSGLSFEFNKNSGNHERASRNVKKNFYSINLYAQTCNCKDFLDKKIMFELNDVRRLCSHLHYIIRDYDLLKRKKDPLEDLLLKKMKRDVWGVHYFSGENNTRFAIIAYLNILELDVAMPRARGDGFTMTRWRYNDGEWTGSGGSSQLQTVVRTRLEELFCA